MKFHAHVMFAFAALAFASDAMAQYPNRPVHMVVGFAPGIGLDTVARMFAQRLSNVIGQPVVVENRTGAGGNVAADAVARALPDGHVLLLAPDSQFVINPYLYPKMTDPLKSLTPVASLAANQFFLAVQPKLPVNSLSEFVDYARHANPPLAYGSAGIGSQGHLSMEMLKRRAGIDLLHVPYRGANQAIFAVINGEVQAVMSGSATASQMEAGTVRGLAVTSRSRLRNFPNVPAIAESYPDYEVAVWIGLFTTEGTPAPVITLLRGAIDAMLSDPATATQLHKLQMRPLVTSHDKFLGLIRSDQEKYGKLIKELGIRIE